MAATPDPLRADIAAILTGQRAAGAVAEDFNLLMAALGVGPRRTAAYLDGDPQAAAAVAAAIVPLLIGDLMTTWRALSAGQVARDPGAVAATVLSVPGPSTHPGGLAGWVTTCAAAVLSDAIPDAA